MFTYFFYMLWLLAHTLVALMTQTRDVYLLAYHRLIRGVLSFTCRDNNTQLFAAELSDVKHHLPEHLTVLLPSNSSCSHLDVLVNLTLWSLATNITHVSFYDPLGLLVKREEELIHQIQSKLGNSQSLNWHGTSTTGKSASQGSKINVKIHTQGRAALVDSCKQLAHSEEELTVPIISKHQLTSYEFPDPQLAIYFDKYLNLCGYPPWQVRLTEFIHGGQLQTFDERRFVDVLKCYTKCEQRVGK